MASAARIVTARSIHIRIHPTAHSLPERREVLRVLERFGEVEMFRSMKYDPTNPSPNSFLSILSTEEAAQAAVDASPIRYRLIADSSPPLDHSSSSQASASPPQAASESIFELRISPSSYPHDVSIASSPLYGTYEPISSLRSPIASDLFSRIPNSIAKPGLVDWVTDSARVGGGRNVRTRRTGEGEGDGDGEAKVQWGRGAAVGGAGTIPWRLRDKERVSRETDVPWVMRGLRSRSRSRSGEED